MDKGLTEERIAEIPNYEFSEVLTKREKLALKLAEKMGIEHQAVDDDFMTLLRSEFSDAEIVELSIVISICIGWGRLLSVFKVEEAEECFHQAIKIAHKQQAKSWELRAVMSLARLWRSQGKRQEAHKLLLDMYSWFTEGFDTADLKDARALLEVLGTRREEASINRSLS